MSSDRIQSTAFPCDVQARRPKPTRQIGRPTVWMLTIVFSIYYFITHSQASVSTFLVQHMFSANYPLSVRLIPCPLASLLFNGSGIDFISGKFTRFSSYFSLTGFTLISFANKKIGFILLALFLPNFVLLLCCQQLWASYNPTKKLMWYLTIYASFFNF